MIWASRRSAFTDARDNMAIPFCGPQESAEWGRAFSATPLAAASSKALLSLPAEAFDDHDEVAGREAGFSPATCDPGLDVLGAIVDNRAQPPLWVKRLLKVGDELL